VASSHPAMGERNKIDLEQTTKYKIRYVKDRSSQIDKGKTE